jgi:hypothetical protein
MGTILSLSLSSAALAVSLLSCSYALRSAFHQSRNGKAKDQFYQDDDGCASPRSLAEFTNRGSKIFIIAFSAIGAGTCIANLVISILRNDGVESIIESSLTVVAWVRLSPNVFTHSNTYRHWHSFMAYASSSNTHP